MAEIRLEPKRRLGWLWLVLLVIVAALILWWLWQNGYLGGMGGTRGTTVLNVVENELATLARFASTA